MTGLLHDLRYAIRQLRKTPGFAAAAILTLALGIGATTGMLGIVESVLIRPLNYRDADRIMLLGVSRQADSTSNISYFDFQEMQRSLHSFDQLSAYSIFPGPVQTDDVAETMIVAAVTTNFFDLLGIHPVLGRSFLPSDAASQGGAVLVGYPFWQKSMHGRRDVIGSRLKINGDFFTVIGVMPPNFQFPAQYQSVWTTLQLTPALKTKQGIDTFSVIGRLKPGLTLERARAEGEAFVRHKPGTESAAEPSHFWIYPYQRIVTGDERPALLALLAACLLLLLIAVVNTANLQIARATRREMEISLRAALGATRARILRQLTVESLLLSFAGAVLAWFLAIGIVHTAAHLFSGYHRFDELRLDTWTFSASVAVTIFCGVASALAPAWYLLNRSLHARQSGAGRVTRPQRLSGALVASEVALTCVLLTGAGLFLRTFRALQKVPLGFEPDHVSSFFLTPQNPNTPTNAIVSAFDRLLDRLQHLPGVQSAAVVTSLPASGLQITLNGGFSIPGLISPGQKSQPTTRLLAISPDYLRTMRIPLLAGRLLSGNDTLGTPLSGIANHALVEKYLRGINPIGQQIVLDKDAEDKDDELNKPITIVGIYGDVIQNNNISGPVLPEVLISYRQLSPSGFLPHFMIGLAPAFVVRSQRDSDGLIRDIRAVVKTEAPDFSIDDLASMNEQVRNTLAIQRMTVQITSVFAWVALLLSAFGIYGVLAYLTGQRVREIGIRLALGATRRNIFALVFRQGAWMIGLGLCVGWVGALIASRWIRSFLFGITTHDALTYVSVGIVILLASAIAIFLPARRAAKTDPMEALRYE